MAPDGQTRGHQTGVGALMDASTLAFHRALLRQVKGAVKAYESWIGEQQVEAMADHLKQARDELTRAPEREKQV